MTEVRVRPCSACPYRCDVASGVWHPDEYEKIRPYDNETFDQPPQAFACHASPEFHCHGWAVVHMNRGHAYELMALRLRPVDIPEPTVPLFSSAAAAADHGQADAEHPGEHAVRTINKLVRRHTRLS
jgi:hypothetical protein